MTTLLQAAKENHFELFTKLRRCHDAAVVNLNRGDIVAFSEVPGSQLVPIRKLRTTQRKVGYE